MTLFHQPGGPTCARHPLHRHPCVMCMTEQRPDNPEAIAEIQSSESGLTVTGASEDLSSAQGSGSATEEKCDKCGRMMPRFLIAIELQDGAPIDDPTGFQWCVVCHDHRVLETLRSERMQLIAERDEARKNAEYLDVQRQRHMDRADALESQFTARRQGLTQFCEQRKVDAYARLDHLSPQSQPDDYERGRSVGRAQAFSELLDRLIPPLPTEKG